MTSKGTSYITFPFPSRIALANTRGFPFSIRNLKTWISSSSLATLILDWQIGKYFLKIVGRTTLAKAYLSTMPNHIMQYIQLPSKIHKLIDTTHKNFIWGSTSTKKKIYIVKWDTIPSLRRKGD